MLIYLKGCYTILGKIYSHSGKKKFQFKVSLKNENEVVVDIIPDERSAEAFFNFKVSKEMLNILKTDICDGRNLSTKLKGELSEMTFPLSQATRKVLSYIKYGLNCVSLSEILFSVKGTYWSIDRIKWKQIPMILHASIEIKPIIPLDKDTANTLQDYIKNGPEPFLALRHLHRAKEEMIPRYKWIDATIAAELAIKEFLIRKEPKIEILLLDIPSPPLGKLYGSVLESCTKERSPKLKEIAKGVEKRNKLIHRPKDVNITSQEAIKYVRNIEIAIYHLLRLCYPEDPIITSYYKMIYPEQKY